MGATHYGEGECLENRRKWRLSEHLELSVERNHGTQYLRVARLLTAANGINLIGIHVERNSLYGIVPGLWTFTCRGGFETRPYPFNFWDNLRTQHKYLLNKKSDIKITRMRKYWCYVTPFCPMKRGLTGLTTMAYTCLYIIRHNVRRHP